MRTFLTLAIVFIAAFSSTNAAVPQLINYQGVLTDSTGAGIDATVSMVFTIYDDPVAGSTIWTETHAAVSVSDGLFTVLLGSVLQLDHVDFSDTSRYLGITVDTDPEIIPRTRLVTVAYAFRTATVDGASGGNIATKVSIGPGHTLSGDSAGIGGGHRNTASGQSSTVGGGEFNVASGQACTIGGGATNKASNDASTVAGGLSNSAGGRYATVGGGQSNTADTIYATISGGSSNTVSGGVATVGGGRLNTSSAFAATVGGGQSDTASGDFATVSGGDRNTASEYASTVAGGDRNTASGSQSTVGGGLQNTASGTASTVSGGYQNIASAPFSTVPGGFANSASADLSFAAGVNAKANHNGSIVIAANSSGSSSDSIASGGNEQLVIRADGGLYFTNTSEAPAPYDASKIITTRGGAYLSGNGTTWTNASDKNQKENFTAIDSENLLEKISELPISRWNYKDEDETVTHIGPVAQDFYALFGVGTDDISISTIDPAGIALAAIKALNKDNKELNKRLKKLEKMIDKLSNK